MLVRLKLGAGLGIPEGNFHFEPDASYALLQRDNNIREGFPFLLDYIRNRPQGDAASQPA